MYLAYAMWFMCIVGICGMQRLYLGQTGLGLAMLFTFGFCGIGQLFDVFLIPQTVARFNEQNADQTLPNPTHHFHIVATSALKASFIKQINNTI